MNKQRFQKKTILVVVEGIAERNFFQQYLKQIVPHHFTLTVELASGNAITVFNKAKEKKLQSLNPPLEKKPYSYDYIFIVYDTDILKRSRRNIKEEAKILEIIAIENNPCFEQVILKCIEADISAHTPPKIGCKKTSKTIKKTFKSQFHCLAHEINWKTCKNFDVSREILLSCPILEPFWNKLLPQSIGA